MRIDRTASVSPLQSFWEKINNFLLLLYFVNTETYVGLALLKYYISENKMSSNIFAMKWVNAPIIYVAFAGQKIKLNLRGSVHRKKLVPDNR